MKYLPTCLPPSYSLDPSQCFPMWLLIIFPSKDDEAGILWGMFPAEQCFDSSENDPKFHPTTAPATENDPKFHPTAVLQQFHPTTAAARGTKALSADSKRI